MSDVSIHTYIYIYIYNSLINFACFSNTSNLLLFSNQNWPKKLQVCFFSQGNLKSRSSLVQVIPTYWLLSTIVITEKLN